MQLYKNLLFSSLSISHSNVLYNAVLGTRMDQHSHWCDTFALCQGLLLKRKQKKIMENPTELLRRTYDHAITDNSGDSEDTATFTSIHTCSKLFHSKLLPTIPANIDDSDISGIMGKNVERAKIYEFP